MKRYLFSLAKHLVFAIGVVCSCSMYANQDWTAFFVSWDAMQLSPVQLPQGEAPIPLPPTDVFMPGLGYELAISPDGSLGVLSDDQHACLIDLTTDPISKIHELDGGAYFYAYGVAISPDGLKAYVCFDRKLVVLSLPDFVVIREIPISDLGIILPDRLRYIAISPTKPEFYVSSDYQFVAVNAETYEVKYSIEGNGHIDSTGNPLVVSPDGSTAYLSFDGPIAENCVLRIDLSLGQASFVSGTTFFGLGVAMTSDGKTACVLVFDHYGNIFLHKIDTQTLAVTTWPVSPPLSFVELAITPDGKTAVMGNDVTAIFLDLSTGSQSSITLPIGINHLAITPDQAPTAQFSSTVTGNTVTFDASASTSPTGTIALYSWNFGDGQTTSIDSPHITHTYDDSGDYSVSLIVTNSAGTSTSILFTGQTASNNGGPSAQMVQQISIAPTAIEPPTYFKGTFHKGHRSKHHHVHKPFISAKWGISPSQNVQKYQIFARNRKIQTISASSKPRSCIHLHPHHTVHRLSKKYRRYIKNKYMIRSVDGLGQVSNFVHLLVE